MPQAATFAIPGDIETLTDGHIYEKQLLLALRRIGWKIVHLQLPGSFPDPIPADVAKTLEVLTALPPVRPVILDGFLTGAMPPEQLARLRAPYFAVTHHPLAQDAGIPRERAASLLRRERANLKRAAHVILPSPYTAQILSADFGVGPERPTVAPPGIPRSEPIAGEKPAVPEILVVGQLVPRKGHDSLLRSLASLSDLDWTASIVGRASDDAHDPYLRDLASSLGISERVRFKGVVAPDALAASYARASVFALATRYEGFGLVFAEAMVHGLPIVTCAAGTVPETVPADAGMLVPADDVGAFAGTLRRVLTDEGHRNALASGSARHGRGLLSWDVTAPIVSAALQKIVPSVRSCSGE